MNTKCFPLLKVSFFLTRSTGGYLAACPLDVLHFKFLLTLPLLSHGHKKPEAWTKTSSAMLSFPCVASLLRSPIELMSRLKQGYLAIMQCVFSAGALPVLEKELQQHAGNNQVAGAHTPCTSSSRCSIVRIPAYSK